jgi:predicted transcriptional regulator
MALTESHRKHIPAPTGVLRRRRKVMSAVSIRIDEPTHDTLRELAKEWDEKISVLLAQAVKDLRRKKFMEALNAEYAALRADPKAWESEAKERAAWDGTLLDGVDR